MTAVSVTTREHRKYFKSCDYEMVVVICGTALCNPFLLKEA